MHKPVVLALCSILGALAMTGIAVADNFADAHYDASTDELVITLRYNGTNADHNFSVQWGACADSNDRSGIQKLDATIEDDQWRDAARDPFEKTLRVNLRQIPCRPAILTLHVAPRFFYTVTVPAVR